MRNIKLRQFAVVLTVLIFAGIAVLFFLSRPQITPEKLSNTSVTDSIPDFLKGKSSFEIGQYYFNADDNTDGPYDIVKAQYFYNQAITENPKGNNSAWYQLGRIDFLNGNFDAALKKFETQREYFGDSIPNVYYMIGLTYGYKARQTNSPEDWKNAEDAFSKAIAFFYEAPWPRVDLAWVYFAQGKYAEMGPVVKEGLAYEANNPWLLNMYGLMLLNTGDIAMAHEYFTFALELAEKMSVTDWGVSYPGNDPKLWEQGLNEFKETLQKNVALTAGA